MMIGNVERNFIMAITNIPKITRNSVLKSPIKNKGNAINRQYARTQLQSEERNSLILGSFLTGMTTLTPLTYPLHEANKFLATFVNFLSCFSLIHLGDDLSKCIKKFDTRSNLKSKMDRIIKRAYNMPKTLARIESEKIKTGK